MDNLANSISLDCIPAADVCISRSEYDYFIALQTRVDTIRDYIQKSDSYPSVDVIKIILGIDKTS